MPSKEWKTYAASKVLEQDILTAMLHIMYMLHM